MAIDHVIVPVQDYEASRRFYEEALRPLGFVLMLDWSEGRRAWFGTAGSPSSLWLSESDAAGSLELCLSAEHRQAVDAFHVDAVGAGGQSSWEPGVRPEFSRDYYATRIVDPDGNSIEVVCRRAVEVGAVEQSVAA